MHPIRIALVGCGEGAARHHLPILARMPGVRVSALVDPDPARRQAGARHAPGAVLLTDHREAAARPDVDAIVLCLPSALHAEAALDALASRKHVYVEKPLATSLGDAARVRAAWRGAGVVGMMGFNYRFNRLYQRARGLLAAGRLGELVAVRTVFSIAERPLPAWKRTRLHGGGALNELGSHHIDLVRFLFGEPIAQVRADIRSRRSDGDTASVQMRLASGLVVQSLFAFGAAEEERIEIHGSGGTLTIDRARHQDVLVERPSRRWRRLRRVAHAFREVAHVPYVLEKRLVPGHEPSHRIALGRFVAVVTDGSPPVGPDLDDGYACVAVVEAAERSACEGRAIAPDTNGHAGPDAEPPRG